MISLQKEITMKFYLLLSVVCLSTVLFSCKNDTKKAEPEVITIETTPEKKLHLSSKTEAEFNDLKVAAIYNSYIELKTALVNTNPELSALASTKLLLAYAEAEMMDEGTLAAIESIKTETDVEAQRKAFVVVTNSVETMLEGALKSGTVYKQFCPMAFGNTGAYWLSNSKEIQNPYFGDKMLKCGRVASEIK